MKYVELTLLCLLLFFSVLCSFGIEEPAFSLQKDYLGASGYPRIIGTIFVVLCVLRMLWLLVSHPQKPSQPEKVLRAEPISKILIPIGLAIAFVYGISTIGFILCTFVYLLLMPFLLDKGATRQFLWKHALYAVLVTSVLYLFFRIFKIYLPATTLF